MRDWKNILKPIVPWLLIVGIMYGMTLMKLPQIVTNLFFVLSTLACMLTLWKNAGESRIEEILILSGVAIRIIVCLIDIYGSGYVTIPFSGDDSLNFYHTSVEYYNGDMSRIYTNYPYILYAIYQIAGLNRFAAQYVNILCWCFCMLLLQKTCRLLKVEKKFRIIAVALYSFLPFQICISSILTRDMFVALSITLSTFCLLQWMLNGGLIFLVTGVVVTAPVILLNNCVVAVLGVLGLTAAFFSPEKKKFCVEKKCIWIMLMAIAVSAAALVVPKFRTILFTQIPVSGDGIINGINERLEFFYTYTGGSTYLLGQYVTDYKDLFFGTFERIGYFLFSPLPSMWRGFSDVAAFFASSCIYIMGVCAWVVSIFFVRRNFNRTILFLIPFSVSGIFAWGVSNGGTAMRHREKFLCIVILLIVYSLQLVKNTREVYKDGSSK